MLRVTNLWDCHCFSGKIFDTRYLCPLAPNQNSTTFCCARENLHITIRLNIRTNCGYRPNVTDIDISGKQSFYLCRSGIKGCPFNIDILPKSILKTFL